MESRGEKEGEREGKDASGDDRTSFCIEIITVVICDTIKVQPKCVSEKRGREINCQRSARVGHKFRSIPLSVPEKFFTPLWAGNLRPKSFTRQTQRKRARLFAADQL